MINSIIASRARAGRLRVGRPRGTSATVGANRRLRMRMRTEAMSMDWSDAACVLGCAWAGVALDRSEVPVLKPLVVLNGPARAMLFGALARNVGLLPHEASEDLLDIQNAFASVAMPMLLFGADLKEVSRRTGSLVGPFATAALGTALGAVCANAAVETLGSNVDAEMWKIAAALAAKNIGGPLNYVFVCDALGVSPDAFAAGIAADGFFALFFYPLNAALARGEDRIPYVDRTFNSEEDRRQMLALLEEGDDDGASEDDEGAPAAAPAFHVQPTLAADDMLAAVFASLTLLTAGKTIAPDAAIPTTTALTVAFATLAPSAVSEPLVEAGQVLGDALVYVIFVAIGACVDHDAIDALARDHNLLIFCVIMYAVHVSVVLLPVTAPPFASDARPPPWSRRRALLASNAAIGGPATAAAFASANGWRDLIVPVVLIALVGNAIGTVTGLAVARAL